MQVAQLLADAAAAGRLQMTEYEARLSKAYAAKTYDELERLSADLPGTISTTRRGGPCHPAPSTSSIMGSQTILVPPEVNVDLRGHGVMGTFDHLETEQGQPGAPRVKVSGFSLWGKVAVKRKKRRTG